MLLYNVKNISSSTTRYMSQQDNLSLKNYALFSCFDVWLHAYAKDDAYILKAIKNATGTSVIFSINISLIHFVFLLQSAPNVGERFTKN